MESQGSNDNNDNLALEHEFSSGCKYQGIVKTVIMVTFSDGKVAMLPIPMSDREAQQALQIAVSLRNRYHEERN